MIGVIASAEERHWVEEFFQLFKTPWEFVRQGRRYRVVLTTGEPASDVLADLTIIYSSREVEADRRSGGDSTRTNGVVEVTWNGCRLPVYGSLVSFRESNGALRSAQGVADYRVTCGARTLHRVGYDLFKEIGRLLTGGQPVAYASSPTLELHIAFLRQSIEASGISYLEIPAKPAGADFICCLTHDVDFFGIRRHLLDRTLAGFVLRGTWGAVTDVLQRRRPLAEALRNVASVLALPLVWMGLRDDYWRPFEDYAAADRGLPSTFFIIPFKNRAGVAPDGKVRTRRAVKYGARDIQAELRGHRSSAAEFAVHGLDAWADGRRGQLERAEVASAADAPAYGVRMHWLFFSHESPRFIEEAGFDYDSTCGYNDAVGYRAGTMQAFHLPGSRDLMELPVMDTAMFYPDRMNLDCAGAARRWGVILADARRFGGALVVNWHDRSLAPERQWHRPYTQLLDELQQGTVWFATAADTVRWFRWRRSVRFRTGDGADFVQIDCARVTNLPPLRVVVRHGQEPESAMDVHAFDGGHLAVSV